MIFVGYSPSRWLIYIPNPRVLSNVRFTSKPSKHIMLTGVSKAVYLQIIIVESKKYTCTVTMLFWIYILPVDYFSHKDVKYLGFPWA